jgi:MFS family permease
VIEARVPEPILPLSLFRLPEFSIASAASVSLGGVLFAVEVYVPVFVQGVLGRSAIVSGLVIIPLSLGWTLASFLAGRWISSTGRYRILPIAGAVLITAAMTVLAVINPDTSPPTIAAAMAAMGVGMGVTWPTYLISTQNAVEDSRLGVATAVLQFFRTIGGSLAIAALGAVLTIRLRAEVAVHEPRRHLDINKLLQGGGHVAPALRHGVESALDASLHTVFLALVAIAALGLPLALMLKEQPLRSSQDPVDESTGLRRPPTVSRTAAPPSRPVDG